MADQLAECPICFEGLKNPIEHGICHKLFCSDCLRPLFMEKSPRCPYCRELLSSGDVEAEEEAEVTPKYSCPICEEEGLDSVNLVVHIEDNHFEASGDCPICQQNGSADVFYEALMSHLKETHDFNYEMYQDHMDLSEEQLLAEIIERSRLEYASS